MDIYSTLSSAYTLSDGRTMRIDSFEGRALFDETTDLPQWGPGAARQAGKMVCVVACAQDAIGEVLAWCRRELVPGSVVFHFN